MMKNTNLNKKFKEFREEEKQALPKRGNKTVIGHAKNGKSEVYFYADGTKEEVNNG